MAEFLVVYASTHGHTARIAGRIAETLRAEDLEVDLRDARAGETPGPAGRDGVVVAASVHGGRHQREIVDWVAANRAELAERPSAFVSVSLTAAEDTEEARTATRRCIDELLGETGWTPSRTWAVAGALQYREYDVFTRVLIRLMMRRGGHPTDTSHDYDYTDWDAVGRFAHEFATLVRAPD
jgi:menaquinone-dependent protoporphyrinogen oxidase